MRKSVRIEYRILFFPVLQAIIRFELIKNEYFYSFPKAI